MGRSITERSWNKWFGGPRGRFQGAGMVTGWFTGFFFGLASSNSDSPKKNETAAQKVIIPAKTYSSGISGTISYNPWGPVFCGYVFVFLEAFVAKKTKTYPLESWLAGKFLLFSSKKPPKKQKHTRKKMVPRDYNL